MKRIARRKLASLPLLIALMLSVLPSAALTPQAAQAEGRRTEQVDQTSADASEEIVYIDANGFIRVLDTQYEANKQVQWVSPVGGWRTMSLGDFDADKDMEIVAIKGSNASDSIAVIYDPVVAKGAIVPGQVINNIPWKVMAEIPLKERPETVAAGNFDPNVPGDEILVVRKVVAGESSSTSDTRIEIFKQTSTAVDGTAWTLHFAKNFDYKIDRTAVANVDGLGGDEVALIGNGSKVEVFQPDQNFRRLVEYASECRPPKDAAFGQYYGGGALEFLLVRKQDCSQASSQPAFQIFTYNATTGFTETAGELFDPEPGTIFTGDINGNGDDEAILLRNVDADTANAKRLFVRGNGDDQIITEFLDGLPLDKDDGYREGAAGDIDGDGKDEPIIIRDTNIRWYPNAHNSAQATDFATTTNKRSVATGDLDRNGANAGPQFAASISKLERDAKIGFVTTDSFILKNGGTEDALPYFAIVDGSPAWLTVSPSTGVATGKSSSGVAVSYTINGNLLTANQVYSATIRIQSNGTPTAANSPFLIPVVIKAILPPFEATPPGASTFYFPCQPELPQRLMQFTISGVPGIKLLDASVRQNVSATAAASLIGDNYVGTRIDNQTLAVVDAAGTWDTLPYSNRAAVATSDVITYASDVPWITSISVPTTTLPTVMTLIISPTLPATITTASLLLFAPSSLPNTSIEVRSYPIAFTCTDWASWMPVAGK